tara:strand:+ start:1312 stop:2202 length:891 start_codon:yes stop_codon:yes gene_type:complete
MNCLLGDNICKHFGEKLILGAHLRTREVARADPIDPLRGVRTVGTLTPRRFVLRRARVRLVVFALPLMACPRQTFGVLTGWTRHVVRQLRARNIAAPLAIVDIRIARGQLAGRAADRPPLALVGQRALPLQAAIVAYGILVVGTLWWSGFAVAHLTGAGPLEVGHLAAYDAFAIGACVGRLVCAARRRLALPFCVIQVHGPSDGTDANQRYQRIGIPLCSGRVRCEIVAMSKTRRERHIRSLITVSCKNDQDGGDYDSDDNVHRIRFDSNRPCALVFHANVSVCTFFICAANASRG